MQEQAVVTTFLFTDIEGSTRLWEEQPARMRPALATHDAITRAAIERNGGRVVKMTGDGVHAAFDDPLGAVAATLELQQALAAPDATADVALRVRCGVHLGAVERRDDDYFGGPVNRAARIMGVAHGGQVLLSEAVVDRIGERLPRDVSLRDLGAVRLRDLARPERVYQMVHPALRRDFPALRSLEATPNNLPQQLTSFVGRERELLEVKSLLGRTRLLTLLGVGGLGKTRLSLQAAADLLDDYPDGIWFVELAPLADPELVPQAVASALGVQDEPGRSLVDTLAAHGKDRRMLLILDNCEHLVDACASLADALLKSAATVRILASSREPLHVPGELTCQVLPLAVPSGSEPLDAGSLAQVEAVRLFVDRATAAQPAFRLGPGNAVTVAHICTRLDGIPLALELAAARVRTLSVERIAERLNDRFRLLTGGSRTALPRQQTLRALIDWSHDLLSEPERAVLRRLAVFAGGWTLEGAEAVGAGGSVDQAMVLDLLANLVEKSLVTLDARDDRYQMLETVREYAQERLLESGDAGDARTRHLAYCVALAEQARAGLLGAQQSAWLARLDLERENLLAAHEWCDRARAAGEPGLRLASALGRYWIVRGLLGLGLRVTVEALGREDAHAPNDARCAALRCAGQLACWMGRYAQAQDYLRESLAIARALGDAERIVAPLQPLALAALGLGDVDAARRYLEEAIALEREQGNQREVASALNALAQIHRMHGDLAAAEPLYRDAVAIARERGDREIIAICLLNLAMVAVGQGTGDVAVPLLVEVQSIAEDLGWRPAGQSMLEVCAGLAASRAEASQAAIFYGAAEAHMGQSGIHRDPTDEAFLAPLVARARDALGPAEFAAAEARGRALPYEAAMTAARAWLVSG